MQIEASTVEIEERGVKLRLTVVDTPGYGDAINCRDWCVPRALGDAAVPLPSVSPCASVRHVTHNRWVWGSCV